MAAPSAKAKYVSESSDHTCPVCFKDAEIFSVGLCDHPICHECSTRMRVLCKEDACPICRREMPKVAFIRQVKPFQQLNFFSYLAGKLANIHFEDSSVRAAFDKLLIHSCHVCSLALPTQQGLKDHFRKEHELFFCDLCIEHLKIFSWERKAYTRQELARHRRKGDPDNTSHRGHPLCNFCDQRYVDGDELFRHLRRDHFFCHFCDADGLNHYYCTYEDLRDHFREEHFLCEEGDCKEEKFTRVFRTDIDFKAHKTQAHKQSLGKAAAKQARTLDLEFTVSRRTENKPKQNRRQQEASGASERVASTLSNDRENPVSGPTGTVEVATADIDNPQEFPSLSSGQEPVSQGGNANKRNDSLAQKLAKGYRFTVKNTDGAEDEDFPSLAPSHNVRPSESTVTASARTQPNGPHRSIQVKVTSSVANTDNSPSKNGKQNTNVSAQLTQKPPMPLPQGAGPPVPRITKVSSSKNIRIQSNLPLQRDSDFPSLSSQGLPPQDWPKSETNWVKKEQYKPIKAPAPKQQPVTSQLKFQAQEEFPSLIPSGKLKSEPLKAQNKSRQAHEPKPKPQASVPTNHAADLSKGKGKKKKNNSKLVEDDDDVSAFKSVTERKIAELQLGEIKSLSSRMGGATLDLGAIASTNERKNLAESKVAIIKPSDITPAELNGVKPKIKSKPSFTVSEFPALSSAPQVTQSLFGNSFNNPLPQASKASPLRDKTKPSKNETENSLSQSPASRKFAPPNDFSDRNHQLISTVADLLCSNHSKISQFRTVSSQFRNGIVDAKQYFDSCMEIMGEDCFLAVFPELLCLLPDIEKQQQLLRLHRAEMRTKKASQEPFVICATCNQVLAPCDLKSHLSTHTLENHFPVLSTLDGNSAWNRR